MQLSDRFLLAPTVVPGEQNFQWRAVLHADGRRRVERRERPTDRWEKVTVAIIINEIMRGGEAGNWLKRLVDAGHLD